MRNFPPDIWCDERQTTFETPGLVRGRFGALARQVEVLGTVYLLLDHSASMSDKGRMENLCRGALRLFTEARRHEYAVGIVGFADRAELLLRATCDGARFWSRLSQLEPSGRTAMDRAVSLATRLLRKTSGDKTILLVTDGVPDSREATLEAARIARAQGITLVAIGIGHADETFLAALTQKPELAVKVVSGQLEAAMGQALRVPRSPSG